MKKITVFVFISLFLAVILAGCGLSLAQDVTPPPYAESYTALDTPVASGAIFPLVPPDPAEGGAIYNEKCIACHGAAGLGDGPQAGQLPVPVAPLGDPSLARQAKPVDWFNMVTKGNLERYMPGFSSLDDRQRWDVVAYALTLSMDPGLVEEGQKVFEQNCQSCHGESGQGSADAPSWLDDATLLAQHSLEEIIAIASEGSAAMPGFAGELSQTEIEAVAVYTRTLSFANFTAPTSAPATTTSQGTLQAEASATPAAAVGTVTIQGKVINGSGGLLPEGLRAVLSRFEGTNQVSAQETDVVDGAYQFEGIEIVPEQTYMVTVDYQGLTYGSDLYHTSENPQESVVDLPIEFYDTTTDVSALRAERMHIFFDFSNPESVQIAELFILTNIGNRVIIPGEDMPGVVEYQLPADATNLQFEQGALGERYVQTEKGFADTAAVEPGSGQQILFAYDVPYSKKMSLSIPIPVDVDAAVVMAPQGSMTLQSDQLRSTGQRDVQGVSLELYTATALTAGSTLEMTISANSGGGLPLRLGGTSGLLIGAAVLGVALIGAGYWLLRQRRRETSAEPESQSDAEGTAEDLMDAIIALDDRYKAGDLPEEAYLRRRNELKEQLRARM